MICVHKKVFAKCEEKEVDDEAIFVVIDKSLFDAKNALGNIELTAMVFVFKDRLLFLNQAFRDLALIFHFCKKSSKSKC